MVNSLENKVRNIAFLSGNAIKLIAVLSMIVDHFSKTLLIVILNAISLPRLNGGTMSFDTYNAILEFIQRYLYGFGRVSFPLFCFLISEGFYHTSSRVKYAVMMVVFAVISEVPFDLLFFGTPVDWSHQNVYFTLLLGICALWVVNLSVIKSDKLPARIAEAGVKAVLLCIIAVVADLLNTDYGSRGVLYITALYLFRNRRCVQVVIFLAVYTLLMKTVPSVFILISALIMLLYNGERGTLRINKYVFYIFYPAHLLLFWLAVELIR